MLEAAQIRRPVMVLALAVALGLLPLHWPLPAARAQVSTTAPTPPVASQPAAGNETAYPAPWHIIKQFDFDEARLGNETDLPMNWYRFKGKDYPASEFPRYAIGYWDRQFGCNSKESFRLELNGGNVGYYYQPNKLAVAPGQDVRIEAMVRTSELNHARALVEVSLSDERGEMIVASRRRSPLLGGPDRNDRWIPVSLLVPGKFASARFVNLSVFVLQPARWRPLDAATRDQPALIDFIDVRGKAWFDDIAVYRLPRVTMTTGQPGQLIPADACPVVNVCVEGFPNQPLEAELSIYDVNSRLIRRQIFNSTVADRAGPRLYRWTSEQSLPAGLYRAELGLYAGGARLAGLPPLLRRHLMFAQLAPANNRAARGHGFGLVLDAPRVGAGLDEAAGRALADEQAEVIARLGANLVKLPMWRSEMKLDQLDQTDPWADQLATRLARQRLAVVATFGTIPQPLQFGAANASAQNLGLRRTLLDVFASDPAVWRPFVAAPLARYAEHVRYWQIGPEHTPEFTLDHRFGPTMDAVRKEFRAQLTAPTFVAPWPAMYSFSHGTEAAGDEPPLPKSKFPAEIINLFLANTLSPNSFGDYVREFSGTTPAGPWATVEPLSPENYQREPRMVDLAWRLAMAAAATDVPEAPATSAATAIRERKADPGSAGGNVFLAAPWTCREASGSELLEPTEELLIFRTAADLLGGSKYAGTIQLADGVIGHIFDRGDGSGTLAVRNLTADPAARIELYLGEQVAQVDLWGNRQPLAAAATAAETARTGGDARSQSFTAGRLPFYLDGVDPRILRLRASFALDPAFVPSSYKKHVRHVQFLNSFDTPISGRLTLRFPDNWEVHPKVIQFSAQAGELFSREVEVRFPYNAEAGVKLLTGDFSIDADRAYRIEVAARFELGLGDVDVHPLVQWMPNDELLVTMNVSNRSDSRLDLFCFVVAPDRPRQERVIAGLPSGGSATKSFRIPDARSLVGQSIRVGLREVRGTRIVNYDVPVR